MPGLFAVSCGILIVDSDICSHIFCDVITNCLDYLYSSVHSNIFSSILLYFADKLELLINTKKLS